MSMIVPTSLGSADSAMFAAKQQEINRLSEYKTTEMDQIDATAKEFEAVFLSEMINIMFKGIKTDPMFGGGAGEEMFRSFMVNEYGREIAHNNGIGIADDIKQSIIDMQAAIDKS